jgi:uncharacterized membrane protein YkoI
MMLRKVVFPAALVAAVAFGGTSAALAASGEHESAKEISAVMNAKVSPSEAIETAEQHTKGHAVALEVGHEKGAMRYEVKAVANDKLVRVWVDPTTGKVIETKEIAPIGELTKAHRTDFRELAGAKTTLVSAIATAERDTGGKAIEADYRIHGGKLTYEVDVNKDGKMQKVYVDTATGEVLGGAPAQAAQPQGK